MRVWFDKNLKCIFYIGWILVSLLQAYFTELSDDEAYYWKYAQLLAWGYFDHPPVMAVLIKMGYYLLHNELGVRLLSILIGTATIYGLERLVRPKDVILFYSIVLSIAVLHFTGFLAIPDVPLLFSATYFLLCYRNFLEQSNWQNAFLLSVTIVAMLLSKYHGVLLVGFVVMSNLSLIKSRYFWFVAGLSLLLLLPHFYWQHINGYPSLQYHLSGRSTDSYRPFYTFYYLLMQPFVLGPLMGFVFIWAVLKQKAQGSFEVTLKWVWWGVYLFFLLMSFKGSVEAHWTLIVLPASVYFGYQYMENNIAAQRAMRYILPVTLGIVVLLRVLIVWDVLPYNFITMQVKADYYHSKEWADSVKTKAGGRPVLFMNSYKHAAKYEFYSGSLGASYNNVMGRRNQYDIWNYEDTARGKEIMLVPNYEMRDIDSVATPKGYVHYLFIPNFQSYSGITLVPHGLIPTVNTGDTLRIYLRMQSPEGMHWDMEANKDYPSFISYQFFKGRELVKQEVSSIQLTNSVILSNEKILLTVVAPDKPGKYGLYFSLNTGWLPPTYNSARYNVVVSN
jgi:hypothetical protein